MLDTLELDNLVYVQNGTRANQKDGATGGLTTSGGSGVAGVYYLTGLAVDGTPTWASDQTNGKEASAIPLLTEYTHANLGAINAGSACASVNTDSLACELGFGILTPSVMYVPALSTWMMTYANQSTSAMTA